MLWLTAFWLKTAQNVFVLMQCSRLDDAVFPSWWCSVPVLMMRCSRLDDAVFPSWHTACHFVEDSPPSPPPATLHHFALCVLSAINHNNKRQLHKRLVFIKILISTLQRRTRCRSRLYFWWVRFACRQRGIKWSRRFSFSRQQWQDLELN